MPPNARPTALCLGTGRFLRSVLVPLLQRQRDGPALIQTRGTSFFEHMRMRMKERAFSDNDTTATRTTTTTTTLEVDTMLSNGQIQTDDYPCSGAFSLGCDADSVNRVLLPQFVQTATNSDSNWIVGVGVTEAGLASHTTQVMQDL